MATRRKKAIEVLTREEVEALISTGSRRAPTGVRNRALVGVLYYGGLRVAEACSASLLPKHLDLNHRTLTLIGKGGVQRTIGLLGPAVPLLERWLAVRGKRGLHHSRPLFCTLAGGQLSDRYVRAMLVRYGRRAGVEKRLHPHALRHSHAHELLDRGALVTDIQHQLGHSSLATTGRYLDSIAPLARVSRLHQLFDDADAG